MKHRYSLELRFDRALCGKISGMWKRLKNSGLGYLEKGRREFYPSIPLFNFPYNSLFLNSKLNTFILDELDNRINFFNFGIQRGEINRLFLQPTTEINLKKLQSEIFKRVGHMEMMDEEFECDNWFPRCTLMEDPRFDIILKALDRLRSYKFPIQGRIKRLNLIDLHESMVKFIIFLNTDKYVYTDLPFDAEIMTGCDQFEMKNPRG